MAVIPNAERQLIDDAVAHYSQNIGNFEHLANSINSCFISNKELYRLVHFLKHRVKEPSHLRDKLERKYIDSVDKSETFDISKDNLFERITDLAGVRLIYLHTQQITSIHPLLMATFEEHNYRLVEDPIAYCWDLEYDAIFRQAGIKTVQRDSMYSTVHYVVEANRRTKIAAEVQVRTLTDEVWGEVSHKVNYPHKTKNVVVQDLLKVLARFTTGCTRLVDSVFSVHASGYHQANEPKEAQH